ncbi:kinase-like domain-containing protein [Limtongia smithiae]|uniref:kinase-like domain-containing protein n=1 Tax=Limtongia smithiae TaxID=1125753 RepID=UPI0034CF4497
MALAHPAAVGAPLVLAEYYHANQPDSNCLAYPQPTVADLPPIPPPNDTKQKQSKRSKEKSSVLCKTPPSLIRSNVNGAAFRRGICLGEGGFARCFEVEDDNGHVYAAKTIAKSSLHTPKTFGKLLGEIKVHQSMQHPNIVKFIECFEDDTNVYILLEMCSNKTLMDMHRRRKRFTETETRFFLIQILGAVKYMHSRKVIHRDLKLGNIFLDQDMNIKIGDFGLAALLISQTDRKKTICGTPNYIAPEILFNKEDGHSFEVDLWSVGIILYAMLIGKPPFQSKDVNLIYKRIRANDYEFPKDVQISDEARDLIKSLLNNDPSARPSLDQIVQHPFFDGDVPASLPASCLNGVPQWKKMTTEVSRANYAKVAAAAGIGPGSGNGGLVSKDAGNPVAALEVPNLLNSTTSSCRGSQRNKSSNKILPECLSPKVSTTNMRHVVSHTAHEYAGAQAHHTNAAQWPPRSRPLTDLPINNASNLPNRGILGRARREGDKEPPKLIPTRGQPSTTTAMKLASADQPRQKYATRLKSSSDAEADTRNFVPEIAPGLREVVSNIQRALAGNKLGEPSTKPIRYITQWVDYSNKYGMGYHLSDGCAGVYFNDATTVILDPSVTNFDYITDSNSPDFDRMHYVKSDVPQSLQKKIYLAGHFRSYMLEHLCAASKTFEDSRHFGQRQALPFMTNYMRNKQAIIFRLSTGEFQFNFMDHYKMVVADNGRRLLLMDAAKNQVEMSTTLFVQKARKLGLSSHSGEDRDQILTRLEFITMALSAWLTRLAAESV